VPEVKCPQVRREPDDREWPACRAGPGPRVHPQIGGLPSTHATRAPDPPARVAACAPGDRAPSVPQLRYAVKNK